MARYCADKNSGPILRAAEQWRDLALLRDGSVFGEKSLWREDHLQALKTHFVDAPDEGEGTFFEKLKGQLAGTPSEVSQLAAEMLWLMFLCPSNVTPAKKRESIQLVWGWSGESLPADHSFLHDDVLDGVGSAGTSFGVHRWRELAFFVRLLRDFKTLQKEEQQALLADGWKLGEWLGRYPESKARQLRHMLLYLLFPDTFERIFGGGDRRLIVQKFAGTDRLKVRALSPLQIDRELARIRAEQEQLYPEQQLDFYMPPLRERWHDEGFDEKTASIEREDVLAALREIDEHGVGEHAESTVYDLVEGARRYPPKLVLSLATKHASGEAFDRSMFAGGVGSRAFNLLRSLGFYIERKDFVSTLLTQFFAQANQAVSLVVKGYPDSYRGLAVRVSFGKGTVAKVPWIAFLGYGQENQNGIYPVFLYYKAEQLLVLARGISDTARPPKLWRTEESSKTVGELFAERFGHEPERYGESYVYRAYRIPADLDHETIGKDLDVLVADYHDLMSSGDESGSPQYPTTERLPEAPVAEQPDAEIVPYSVKEATEGLFMTQGRFEEILATWRQKKNLVIQGPPGVGKTFFFRRLAYALMATEAPGRITSVQFHPSYSYEDFVQGYRPTQDGFVLRNGTFYRFCEQARADSSHPYVFVIDEINRGNLAKIFGELLMLLEADKRSPDWAVPLAYSGSSSERFFIPENVYLLGLMNTADRSLAVVDYALRRRFAFVSLRPEYASPRFKEYLEEKGVADALARRIIGGMSALNDEIAKDRANLGPGYCIGHSFFCDPPEEAAQHEDWYAQVVTSEIAPLLDEYYFDDPERAQSLVERLRRG